MSEVVLDYSGQELNDAIRNFKANYKNTSDGNITSDTVLAGQIGYNAEGKVIGEMVNNGEVDKSIDGITETSYTIPKGYHNGEGSVKLTDDIANEVDSQSDIISQIKSALQGKAVGEKQEQSKEVTIKENGVHRIEPDDGYTLSGVDVNVDINGLDQNKEIHFYDYDGTLLYTYSIQEIQELAELPLPPDHSDEGLVFQEWNWNLEEVKKINRRMNIGANYDTFDKKTRIYFTLNDPNFLSPALNFEQNISNNVIIDWGDGSEKESTDILGTSTNSVVLTHNYHSIGSYIITLETVFQPLTFSAIENGGGNYLKDLLTTNVKGHKGQSVYYDSVDKIQFGSNCTKIVGRSSELTKCSIPKEVVEIAQLNSPFIVVPRNFTFLNVQTGRNIQGISLPPTIKTISSYCFNSCRNLKNVTIPDGVGKIENYSFNETAIEELYTPDSVTEIGNRAFSYCYFLKKIRTHDNIKVLTASFQGALIKNFKIPHNEALTTLDAQFIQCYRLESIEIPENITIIKSNCLAQCTKLSKIIIPSSVVEIQASAFNNCQELIDIKILSPSVIFGNYVFQASANGAGIRYYDFTKATVIDGSLSYTFGTQVFQNIREGTKIMFATKEIAEVAKTTTNLVAYADYIHYLGEEG